MLVAAATSRGMIVIATVILSHLLAPRDLGRMLYFLTTSATGAILIAQGASTAALSIVGRMLPDRRRAARAALMRVYGFALAVAVLLAAAMIVAGPLAMPDVTQLGGRSAFALLAISTVFQGFNTLTLSMLAGFAAFRMQSLLYILGSFVQYAVVVACAAAGALQLGLVLFAAAMAASFAMNAIVVARIAARHGMPLRVPSRPQAPRRAFGRSILGFVALTTIGAMLFEPVNWLCVSLLLARPGGATQVAAFLAANQWFAIILFVPINLTQVTLPMVSRAYRETGRLFGPAARRMLAISLGASGAVGAILLVLMPLLLRLYAPALRAMWTVFAIIAVNGMIVAVQVATGQMMVAAARVRANLLFNAGWASIYLIATITIVTSAAGLAASRLAAYACHAVATLAYLLVMDLRARRAQVDRPGT